MRRLCLVLHNQLSQSRRCFARLLARPLWILLSHIPHNSSQALANNIFQNVGPDPTNTIPGRRWGEQELEQVHPTVQVLVRLWDLTRNGLVRAFRSTLPDKCSDVMYVNAYVSLYTLCQLSSEATASDLTSVQQLDHLTAPPSIP